MLDVYQHLPEYLDPIAFSIGSFSIRWYAVAYLLGLVTVYGLLFWRIKKEESDFKLQAKSLVSDWLLWAMAGLLIGGRLGYVLFYQPGYYFQNPLAIISPLDNDTGNFTGILGMSYFGGLMGVTASSLIFVRRKKINFWSWADFVIPAIPAGYFWGRLGNFINGELYGRETLVSWGMYFPNELAGRLRHPSQVYEALLEGLVLFVILWIIRKKSLFPGFLLASYLLGYGIFRLGVEFFREESPFWLGLTEGQLFSLVLVFFSLGFIIRSWKNIGSGGLLAKGGR